LALMLITIPIFYPVIQALNYDAIWFGVIVVVVTQMGVISPPVGVNVYVVNGIERDIPLQTVFKGALPFLFALILSAFLLMVFPEIAVFLPEQGPAALGRIALVATYGLASAWAMWLFWSPAMITVASVTMAYCRDTWFLTVCSERYTGQALFMLQSQHGA